MAPHKPQSSIFGTAEDFDPALSKLFSSSSGPVQAPPKKNAPFRARKGPKIAENSQQQRRGAPKTSVERKEEDEPSSEEVESSSSSATDSSSESEQDQPSLTSPSPPPQEPVDEATTTLSKRQRKRQLENDTLESDYLARLAREEQREAREGPQSKRAKLSPPSSPPPLHETLTQSLTTQPSTADKAASTVFLGNVSTTAITSKAARRTLVSHLSTVLASPTDKLVSLRFRSTPYSDPHIPARASYARAAVHAATTPATHAYAVYSSPALATAAVTTLNGSEVLSRHLRVDTAANPAPFNHRRCIFVGNLGFVDDDGGAAAANAKQPKSDVEEGLWRLFNHVSGGGVAGVRVVRDARTRVGKGFAYVAFAHENGVEAALPCDGKRYPEFLLPRTLRVVRARKNGGGPKVQTRDTKKTGAVGRAKGKVSRLKNDVSRLLRAEGGKSGGEMVFEGHRADEKSRTDLAKKRRRVKPTGRGARRGAAWKKQLKDKDKGKGKGKGR